MSSVLRTFSQIPVRAKYLLVATDTDVSTGDVNLVSGFVLDSGAYLGLGATATVAEVQAAPGFARLPTVDVSLDVGNLYKDLGRQITIYDPLTSNHLAVFRQVQFVNGAETEGVCDSADRCANIFVKVWGADGNGVVVVRTG